MATAMNVSAWSTTAASNDGADSTIGTVANTSQPNVVDDWVRGVMAAVKRYVLDTDGGITAGGTADALTITTNRVISSGHQAAGFSVRFKAGNTNTGAATVAVDGLSAVSIKRLNGDALGAGDIIAGAIYDIAFDGTNYQLLGVNTPSASLSGSSLSVSGNGTIGGTLGVTGATTLSSTLAVGGAITANGSGHVIGNASGDAVTIKGTTVNSNISAMWDAASAADYVDEVLNAANESFTISPSVDKVVVKDETNNDWGPITVNAFIEAYLGGLSSSTGEIIDNDLVLINRGGTWQLKDIRWTSF